MDSRSLPIDIHEDAKALAERALAEDGARDVTSLVAGADGLSATGAVQFRSGGVLAGLVYAEEVVRQCRGLTQQWSLAEGEQAGPHEVVGKLSGDLAEVLRAERPMLNLLQRACGIASATRAYVQAVAGTSCQVLHTRKTAPGLRGLDLSAVLAGGGGLHRASLETEVLLKDNHWHSLSLRGLDLRSVCDDARSRGVERIYIEVETEGQLREACAAGATRLLIDNQVASTFGAWCELARSLSPEIELEASGGITLENVAEYARAGADYVSIGALTHSVVAADLALEIVAVHSD